MKNRASSEPEEIRHLVSRTGTKQFRFDADALGALAARYLQDSGEPAKHYLLVWCRDDRGRAELVLLESVGAERN
jgi:hypothetical protein